MGILSRFKDIMSANINALLDKVEDPEKMIDQCLRNMNDDLVKVKQETASVMAKEKACKRQVDECQAGIDKMQSYAVKALTAGNEDDVLLKGVQCDQCGIHVGSLGVVIILDSVFLLHEFQPVLHSGKFP